MDDRIARGVNFVFAKEYLQRELGAARWDAIAGRMAPLDGEVWRNPFPMNVYPFSSFMALLGALAQEPGEASEARLAQMYEYIADRSLSTLYKVFFRMMNPGFVIGNYPKLWSRFFTAGEVEVTDARPGGAVVHFTVPLLLLDWLPAACLGYSTRAVKMAGGQLRSLHEVGRRMGPGEYCRISYELRWGT
jgi:hypothetical protein